jgi:hypothetical protein
MLLTTVWLSLIMVFQGKGVILDDVRREGLWSRKESDEEGPGKQGEEGQEMRRWGE